MKKIGVLFNVSDRVKERLKRETEKENETEKLRWRGKEIKTE